MPNGKLLPETVTLCAILMVVGYAFAQTWTQTSAGTGAVESVALSADGHIIASAGSPTPLVSTNWGVTWIRPVFTPALTIYLRRVAVSADGTKMAAVGPRVAPYISQDSGITWVQVTSPSQNLLVVAISADGSNLFAGEYGGLIFKSTNFGTNWVATGAPSKTWTCIAPSSDGTKLAAGTLGDRIFTSTNSGLTWTPTSAPSNSWSSIASSSDGSHLIATGSNIYISTNSGGSWTPVSIPGFAAASSADGSKLIVVASSSPNNTIYTSTNFGINWASTNIANASYLMSVASSADGNELLVGANYGIWMYQDIPSPQLNLTFSNNYLAFSWLTPSTNFVLQQNLDLTTTNWLTLTNVPTLNFANLNNELTLSSSNSSGFYRLATP